MAERYCGDVPAALGAREYSFFFYKHEMGNNGAALVSEHIAGVSAKWVWGKISRLDVFQWLPSRVQSAVYQCPDGYDADADVVKGTRVLCECVDGTHALVVGEVDSERMVVEFEWIYPDGSVSRHVIRVVAGDRPKDCDIAWEMQAVDNWWSSARDELVHRLRVAFGQGEQGQVRIGAPVDSCTPNVVPYEEIYEGVTQVLDLSSNTFVQRHWSEVRVGDVIRLEARDYSPADALILHASSPAEICVSLACIDGDMSLRHRQVLPLSLPFDALGSGPERLDDLRRIQASAVITVPPPAYATEFEAVINIEGGAQPGVFTYKQMLWRNSQLLLTDYVVAVVIYTGVDTGHALRRGWLGTEYNRKRRENQEKRKKQREERQKQERIAALSVPIDPLEFERSTGIQWSDRFTNVKDDGNCLMHAVWLGLSTLIRLYPEARLHPDETLPADHIAFRTEALQKMAADELYRESVRNFMRLFISVDGTVLFALEDFFTLPEQLQAMILELNQNVQLCGANPEEVDLEPIVDQYVGAMSEVQTVTDDGTQIFTPLGAVELDALCRVYRIRLQTVKSEALDMLIASASAKPGAAGAQSDATGSQTGSTDSAAKKVTDAQRIAESDELIRNLDPRTIRPEHLSDNSQYSAVQPDGSGQTLERIVRILNVRTNHYMVHLPRRE